MKLTLPRNALLKALDFVTRAAARKSTIPILGHVRLEATSAGLTLCATNLDLEAQTRIDAEVAASGALTVAATTLHDIARKLADGAAVSLDAAGENPRLAVKSGRARFALQTLPVTDWPDLQAGELPHRFALDSKILLRALQKTAFAISTEETRYYLNGVYLHVAQTDAGPELRFVATDGHRLARFGMPAPKAAQQMPGVIVPRQTCAEIARLAQAAPGGAVALALSESKIAAEAGDMRLLSKLIDGTFPDYERVIPRQNDKTAILDRAGLAAAIDRVSVLSSERGRAVKLDFADAALKLSVVNADIGDGSEELEADYDTDPLTTGFNAKYVNEALAALDGKKALFELGGAGDPALLRDPAAPDLLIVLMPMRVS
ncbi:DNA polymerase III subunit beta [Rhodoblastus sp. 17X3]|uniref:DNA polymerase III subunit beta n=1 Tax=Rhodoblastus sp. 17X3 TaxID=3047026 RepID=UPI0024B720C6|nr:DNA polymerase III subunit beta [Rhodoblastus sp. 17X3]MDI9847331.1 DNA polymerase III subunit beta [Rhodoblastus sp. 17X3]